MHINIIRLRDGGNASLGLVERPWSTERRGNPPPFIFAQRGEGVLMAEKILLKKDRVQTSVNPQGTLPQQSAVFL